jgi:hypothetical protein
MKILVEETGKIDGRQTLIIDEKINRLFLVNTVVGEVVNKTFILHAKKDGTPYSYNEVFTLMPGSHDFVLKMLLDGQLTADDFNFKNLDF